MSLAQVEIDAHKTFADLISRLSGALAAQFAHHEIQANVYNNIAQTDAHHIETRRASDNFCGRLSDAQAALFRLETSATELSAALERED